MVETGCKILLPWALLCQFLIVNGIDVTPAYPKKFDTVVLTVNASGHTSIQWVKDSVTLTSCFVGPGVCPNPQILPGATIAINTAAVESTITIDSANQTFHGGHYEATGSIAVDVLVNTVPASVNWTTQPQGNLTSVSSVEWIAKIYCVYPTSEINVHFTVYAEGYQVGAPRYPTLSVEPDSSCDSPEETVVAKLSLSPSDFLNQRVYLFANASHASFPTEPSVTSGQSAEAFFQGVHTSTPTSITKPPPENTCILGIPDIPCWIIFAVVIILVLIGLPAFVYFKLCEKQQSDEQKIYHDTTNDGATQAYSTVKITHEDSAIRGGDNRSVFKPNNQEPKDGATDERAKQSRKSTIDKSQHENVLNDGTNIGGKNGKKEESTNGKDDNVSLDTPNHRQSNYSANGKKVNKSSESTFMDACSLKQNESLFNNDKNIEEKDDKNVSKSEDVETRI